MKRKFTITLSEADATILHEALRTVQSHPAFQGSYWQRWLLQWMIRAGSAAIVKAGKLQVPFAFEIRSETPSETRARCAHVEVCKAIYSERDQLARN